LCALISGIGATSCELKGKDSCFEDAEIMENLTAPLAIIDRCTLGGATVYFIEFAISSLML